MLCEKCKTNMIHVCENSVQGWSCPVCGWGTLTTYIDKIHQDMTEYSICTKSITNIDKDKIKVISKIAGVNYIVAKQMLEKEGICILKQKAVDIKKAICELENVNIPFEVIPEFNYWLKFLVNFLLHVIVVRECRIFMALYAEGAPVFV